MTDAHMFVPKDANRFGRKVALAEMTGPHLHAALALWHEKRGRRSYPSREDMSPSVMKAFLRNVTLVRVIDAGAEFEFRIAGDGMVVAYGINPIGQVLSSLPAKFAEPSFAVLRAVLRRRGPLAVKGTMEKTDIENLQQETLFLPLGADESAVDHVLIVGGFVQLFAGKPGE